MQKHTAQESAAIAAFQPTPGHKYIVAYYGPVDEGDFEYGIHLLESLPTLEGFSDHQDCLDNYPGLCPTLPAVDMALAFGVPWVYVPGIASADYYVGLASRWAEIQSVLPTAQCTFGGADSPKYR